MPPEQADRAVLWDMQRAAKDVSEFVEGLKFETFARDKRTRFAVERQLLVIGEAAGRVSSTTREQYPEIPWTSMIGLRNVLAHDYGDILVERIWLVARDHIPPLLIHLAQALRLD